MKEQFLMLIIIKANGQQLVKIDKRQLRDNHLSSKETPALGANSSLLDRVRRFLRLHPPSQAYLDSVTSK